MESFYSHFEKLVGTLSDRSQAIVRERFGVTDGRVKTFEEIGKKYGITGDRVRRITRSSLKDIETYDKDRFQEAERSIESVLRSKSGIMSEADILKVLGKGNVKETAALRFFLECLSVARRIKRNARKEVKLNAIDKVKRSSWSDTSSKGNAKMRTPRIPLSFVVLVAVVSVCIYLFVSFLPKESAPVKFKTIQQESEVLPVNVVEKDQQEIAPVFDATKTIVFADRKARGSVIIYNEYSARPQILVASTRLLSREGKLFRLVKKVTIPGMTKTGDTIEPGAVEADVIADQPGEEYNVEPTSFTIPGFEGNVKKYGKFYAQSSNAMSGGEAGT